MILLERCVTVRAEIEKRDALRRSHKDAESLRLRAEELSTFRVSLGESLEKINVLRAKDVAVGKLPESTAAVNSLQEYGRKLSEDPLDSGKEYGRLKRSVGKLGDDLAATTAKALDLVKRSLPSIEESFLKQVETIPKYADQVARIRRERDALLRGTDPHSMSAAALVRFLESRDALRRIADELRPEEFPKEVLEFFKAARHGGAPWDKLTETVRQWLIERDQLKSIRITVVDR
jgi:hypothetical protein